MKKISHLSKEEKEALFHYLKEFVTNERLKRFEDIAKLRTRFATIVVENLFQPHNISAVLRTADCFGFQDVHIIENENKTEFSPEIELGSSQWLSIYHYNSFENNTVHCLQTLKNQGYYILSTTPHTNNCTIDDFEIDKPLAVVFGTEKDGITDYVREYSDQFVKIPMYGFTESFNISVSAALVMNTLSNKMRKSNIDWQLKHHEQIEIKINWLMNSIKSSEAILDKYLKSNSLI